MIKINGQLKTGRIIKNIDKDINITFSELCLDCKFVKLVWADKQCYGCAENQLFPGTISKFRREYPEYRGKKR